jgi:hypothetical protein
MKTMKHFFVGYPEFFEQVLKTVLCYQYIRMKLWRTSMKKVGRSAGWFLSLMIVVTKAYNAYNLCKFS